MIAAAQRIAWGHLVVYATAPRDKNLVQLLLYKICVVLLDRAESVMNVKTDGWKPWMHDFKFGIFTLVPDEAFKKKVDRLRQLYDPESARICCAHMTVTQPFQVEPSSGDLEKLANLIRSRNTFHVMIGPAVTSPNRQLVWLDVEPKHEILSLRTALHNTGLFNTALPFTEGFIPHMTISELRRSPEEAAKVARGLNETHEIYEQTFSKIFWLVPNEEFVFRERGEFHFS